MRVTSLHRKARIKGERGIPKPSVDELAVTAAGVEGDYNRYRAESLKNDPGHAVLLLPTEILASLRAEGWPVAPGDLGENIATEGLLDFAPGLELTIGDARLELTEPCVPCANLRILPYIGREKQREFIKTLIDRRGFYARVLRAGTIRRGDVISVLARSSASRTSG